MTKSSLSGNRERERSTRTVPRQSSAVFCSSGGKVRLSWLDEQCFAEMKPSQQQQPQQQQQLVWSREKESTEAKNRNGGDENLACGQYKFISIIWSCDKTLYVTTSVLNVIYPVAYIPCNPVL